MNKQAMWSVMAMLTIWCTWNSARISNAIQDNKDVNNIVNNLVEEYNREEVSINASASYEDTYFPQTFSQYKALYGSGYKFDWNGKSYTTDYKEDVITTSNGWVLNSDDYDDYCKSNYHDTCGICDGNGEIKWFADRDKDGLGDITTFITSCDEPVVSTK